MDKQPQFAQSGSRMQRKAMMIEGEDLALISCRWESAPLEDRCPPNQYLLLAISQGQGTCTLDGIRCQLREREVLLIFPETEYAFSPDPQEGCRQLWLAFTGIRAEVCMLHAGFSREHPIRSSGCIPQMEQFPDQLFLPQIPAAHRLRANGRFQILLAELMEEYTANTSQEQLRYARGPKTSDHVKRAMDYISRHYSENVKICELADFVGINRSYLASSFKKVTGYSPKEYLLNLRMEKAKSLLETTQLPISSISGTIGYEDPLAFSRIFKRYSGLSPTDYREKYKSTFE